MTAPHYACENGHLPVADALLRNLLGEARNFRSYSQHPLVTFKSRSLLQKKASIHGTDERRANALHWAAQNGHVDARYGEGCCF
jgi:ankyrin repeat protein